MGKEISWEPKKVNVSDLNENPSNPKILNQKGKKRLQKTLAKYGLAGTLIVNTDMTIIDGHSRKKELLDKGIKEVWVSVPSRKLTEKEYKEFNAVFDLAKAGDPDVMLMEEIFEEEFFDEWEVDRVKKNEVVEDDFEVVVPKTPITIFGDLYEIGQHRLICGDSGNSDDVLKLMNDKKADMVFTDPPYGVAYVGKTKDKLTIESDNVSAFKLKEFVNQWFSGVDLITRGGAYILATVPPGPLHLIFAQDWLDRGWLRQIMVWNKSAMVMGHSEYHYKHEPILFGWKEGGVRLKNKDRTKTTVWDFDKPNANKEHPTMKPVKMWAYGIGNHTNPGDILYEPFSGSGTTMVASHQLNRKCYGVELDPKYCDVIIVRMVKLARETASSLVIKRNGKQLSNQEITKYIENAESK